MLDYKKLVTIWYMVDTMSCLPVYLVYIEKNVFVTETTAWECQHVNRMLILVFSIFPFLICPTKYLELPSLISHLLNE